MHQGITLLSQLQIPDQDLPQQVQAGAIKKSNYFAREASKIDTKIEKDEEESDDGEGHPSARTSTRTSHERKCNRTHNRVATKRLGDIEIRGFADDCVERYEFIKDGSTKDMIVSDENDTETSSFGVINSENEVKKKQFS